MTGESEPEAVLAVDIGELTAKAEYCAAVTGLSAGLSVQEAVDGAVDVKERQDVAVDEEAGRDRLAATAANEIRGVGKVVM